MPSARRWSGSRPVRVGPPQRGSASSWSEWWRISKRAISTFLVPAPRAHSPCTSRCDRSTPRIAILARTLNDSSVSAAIVALVRSLDSNLPILSASSLDEELNNPDETQLRIAASVSGSVGIIGVLLAGIGIYGVTAYAVARRTRGDRHPPWASRCRPCCSGRDGSPGGHDPCGSWFCHWTGPCRRSTCVCWQAHSLESSHSIPSPSAGPLSSSR